MEAPDAIKWLNELGVEFDKQADGTMVTTHGGGTSRKRMHAAKDYSGAEIMRTPVSYTHLGTYHERSRSDKRPSGTSLRRKTSEGNGIYPVCGKPLFR